MFVVFGLSDTRASATASFGATLLGVTWVGAGLACLLLVRDIPEYGFVAVMAVLCAPVEKESSYTVLNARIGYAAGDGRWSVAGGDGRQSGVERSAH